MSGAELYLVAVALAMDASAVALAAGICLPQVTWRHTFRLAWHFGLFQALMPVLGWLLGLSFRFAVETFAPWIAFALLAFVGGRMVKEGMSGDKAEDCTRKDPTRGKTLIMLSVATSIDALAVGLSLSVLGAPIVMPAVVIGLTCAVFTALALHLGRLAGRVQKLSHWAETLGGLVLIAIGVRILWENGVFGR